MAGVRCLVCNNLILQSNKRRNIKGESLREEMCLLKEILRNIILKNTWENLVLFVRVAVLHICQSWFVFKKEMKELSESLETTIRSSYAASNMSRVSPPRKHSLSQDIDTETPRKKMRREAMNTPTRSFLSKPFVESSPVVAVSDCIKCDYMCLLLSTIGS